MSTPLPPEKVNEIRDIFDYQQQHPESFKPKMNYQPLQAPDRQKEKEAVLSRLALYKESLDSKMQPSYPPPRSHDQNQTMDVNPADDTWMQSSDESFLRLEQGCDKTVLPRSQALAQDPEMAAINRLMREYQLDKPEGGALDQTQLDDIEPPSGIWDTTVMAAKMNASPVKMMHALRPSTIIEETLSSNLGNDSVASSSYKTADSGYSKVAPSEQYETATDTICVSSDSSSNVIEILDDSLESRQKERSSSSVSGSESIDNSSVISAAVAPVEANGTLDGVSSLLPDSSVSTISKNSGDFSLPESRDSLLDETPDFNDTLERIDYMEQQGMKLLQKQKATPSAATTSSYLTTPSSAAAAATTGYPSTPNMAKTLLPSSSTKRVFYPSPTSNNPPSNAFKKPGAVRSPQIKFVSAQKRNFDHIVSPIATYIKDVPTSTMYTKYKGQCLFSKSSPIKPEQPQHQQHETKENKQSQLKPPQWNIPRKVFTSTNNRHEIDNRQVTKIPGGSKVHQMVQPALGQPNKIIRHEGRVKMDLHPTQHQPRDSIFDETLANMSVVSGDVSIQVIRDMKKH